MKKNLLLTATAVLLSLCGYAQTKGTNTLGFGANVETGKTQDASGGQNTERKYTAFSLGYGHFIKDNARLGIEFTYGTNRFASPASNNNWVENESSTYGASLNYQHYYPLFKTLFAFAGGNAYYGYSESTEQSSRDLRGHVYAVGARGGLTWFVSKRFAFETSLLSADVSYITSEEGVDVTGYKAKATAFNLNTSGLINGLGFKIYLLF